MGNQSDDQETAQASPPTGAHEGLAEQARDVAKPVIERVRELGESGKNIGADQIAGVARAAAGAADMVAQEMPGAARYIRDTADGLKRTSSALRQQSPGDIYQAVEDFARRQPAAFFGASVLAGFLLLRLLRNASLGSSEPVHAARQQARNQTGARS